MQYAVSLYIEITVYKVIEAVQRKDNVERHDSSAKRRLTFGVVRPRLTLRRYIVRHPTNHHRSTPTTFRSNVLTNYIACGMPK